MSSETSAETAGGGSHGGCMSEWMGRHLKLSSFLILWLVCALCLGVRHFYPAHEDLQKIKNVEIDVYARYDFSYIDGAGGSHICRTEERLAQVGQELNEAEKNRLKAYVEYLEARRQTSFGKRIWGFVGKICLLGLMLGCFVFCLHILRPAFFNATNRLVLCMLLTFGHFGLITFFYLWRLTHGCESTVQLLSLLPLFLVPALTTYLIGTRVSICLTVLLTSLTSLLLEGDFQFVLFQYTLICSLIGIAAYHWVTRYGQLFMCGCYIFFSVLLLDVFIIYCRDLSWAWNDARGFAANVVGLSFWHSWEWSSLLTELHIPSYWDGMVKMAFLNAVFTTLVMLGVPRFLERFFDVISPITLRKLSTKEHPLLVQMKNEARGTYQHCGEVGDMAEEAAKAIGANAMLARVCGYFHDIGKLRDPRCFGENDFGSESPHKFFTPYESSEHIRDHVSYGVELAHKHHLPVALIEAIQSHHGNDLAGPFYMKACKEAEAAGQPKPEEKDFHYDAPLPHRKEVVIVEIADICEAAGRSVLQGKDTLDEQIVKEFVDKRVMEKMQHRQFAKADMSMAELSIICDKMADYLLLHYYKRPKYSSEETTTAPKQKTYNLTQNLDALVAPHPAESVPEAEAETVAEPVPAEELAQVEEPVPVEQDKGVESENAAGAPATAVVSPLLDS